MDFFLLVDFNLSFSLFQLREILNVDHVETDRIKLRDYEMRDWQAVHQYAKNPNFSKYVSWGPNTIEDTKMFIQYSENSF